MLANQQNRTSKCPVCSGHGEHKFNANDLMFNGKTSYQYSICTGCRLIYQNPMPPPEAIGQFYPDSYHIFSEPTRTCYSASERLTLINELGYSHLDIPENEMPQRPKRVNEVIPYVHDGRLLDIGCGNGEYLLRVKSIGWKCQGVEFNDAAVSICRAHGLNVFHGDLAAAKFESDRFDFVTAHHLIEHVPDPNALMAEIARITKPGGAVLLRTPNSEALGRRWFGRYWYPNDFPRHLMLFSEKNLSYLARQHGFTSQFFYKPIDHKFVLKSLDYLLGIGRKSKHRKISKWLAKLYIPLARVAGQGDELFAIYRKNA